MNWRDITDETTVSPDLSIGQEVWERHNPAGPVEKIQAILFTPEGVSYYASNLSVGDLTHYKNALKTSRFYPRERYLTAEERKEALFGIINEMD
jgi:hypothetical protein